jgi:AcrR family transcriptional regulator
MSAAPHSLRTALPREPEGAANGDPATTRCRLIHVALRLFAQQGYAKTSIRELAQAACVNIAAISYYFRDKAGLYRAVFFEPLGEMPKGLPPFLAPQLPLDLALRGFFGLFLEPLGRGEDAKLCIKLRMREMIEPTGLWQVEVDEGLRPMHEALVALLCRHLGLAEADDEIHRLAVCISGLGVHLHLGRDATDAIAPQLNAHPQAAAQWGDCLVRSALALVQAEQSRRLELPPEGLNP